MLRRGSKLPNGRVLGRVLYNRELPEGEPEERTLQEFKDENNPNKIWAMFNRTGDLSLLQKSQGYYADVTEAPSDYLTALNIVKDADTAFNNLPAAVRTKFKNNPAEIEAWLSDAANRQEAIDIGLIPKPVEAQSPPRRPDSVEPTPTPQPAAVNPAGGG